MISRCERVRPSALLESDGVRFWGGGGGGGRIRMVRQVLDSLQGER